MSSSEPEAQRPPFPELHIYGAAMLTVQMWEMALATLRFAVEIDPNRKTKNLEREVTRTIKRTWHFYRKASVREQANALKENYSDEAVLADVDDLIPLRDRLAHRYLREKVPAMMAAQDQGLPADPAMCAELLSFDLRFEASKARLSTAFLAIIESFGSSAPSQEDEAFFESLAQAILTGTPMKD